MNWILSQLGSIGGFLAAAGVMSSVMIFFGYNLKILMWIDMWGPAIGWVIRIALIVGGIALVILSRVFKPQAQ